MSTAQRFNPKLSYCNYYLSLSCKLYIYLCSVVQRTTVKVNFEYCPIYIILEDYFTKPIMVVMGYKSMFYLDLSILHSIKGSFGKTSKIEEVNNMWLIFLSTYILKMSQNPIRYHSTYALKTSNIQAETFKIITKMNGRLFQIQNYTFKQFLRKRRIKP